MANLASDLITRVPHAIVNVSEWVGVWVGVWVGGDSVSTDDKKHKSSLRKAFKIITEIEKAKFFLMITHSDVMAKYLTEINEFEASNSATYISTPK